MGMPFEQRGESVKSYIRSLIRGKLEADSDAGISSLMIIY